MSRRARQASAGRGEGHSRFIFARAGLEHGAFGFTRTSYKDEGRRRQAIPGKRRALQNAGVFRWKIDDYAPDRLHGCEDPANPTKTTHILTIMLAEEH